MSASTPLPTCPLGSTGMTISRVGFGAWAIGGAGWKFAWGSQDDADSVAAIRRAVESGVNWIDTAPVYGLGHSETIVGQAIANLPEPDRPYVFTKCGLVWSENDRTAPPRKIMTPANVRREVDDSLRRLGLERIDFYQVHWPGDGLPLNFADTPGRVSADATPLETYWQVMADLKAEGKVRAIGLSNHGAADLDIAEKIAHVDGVQPQFSALARTAADDIVWARQHNTGVIVYQPMHSGLLSGAFSTDRVAALPDDDWRKTAPDFTTRLEANLAVADTLRGVAARHRVTTPAVAVAWTLAWPGVTGAIVGARRPAQVDDWAAAGSVSLTDADLDEISTAITAAGAGVGPNRPPRT